MSNTPEKDAAITISHVTFRYPSQDACVLEDISLSVPVGQRLAVLGASGSGKSTLLRIIARLSPPQEGNVHILGRVALLQQDPAAQIVGSTVCEDVLFTPRNQKLPAGECLQRCRWALDEARATHLAERKISELSAGELQRVALAGALAAHPDVLLLDEPSAHLDAAGRAELSSLIKRLCDKGVTVVEVTHSLRSCRQADAVALLHKGRLLTVDAPVKVLSDKSQLQKAGVLPKRAVMAGGVADVTLSKYVGAAGSETGAGCWWPVAQMLCGQAAADEVIATLDPPLLPSPIRLTPGSCTAIVGRTGSGKTRLALSLLGISPTGEPMPRTHRGICLNAIRPSILFQQPERYFWGTTVADELPAISISRNAEPAPNAELLPTLGLPTDLCNRRLSSLSEGELRRTALAISMAGNPDFLIADEPFAGLDLLAQAQVEAMLLTYVQAGGCLLLITTDRRALRKLASQCVVMREGVAIHAGDISNVLTDRALAVLAGISTSINVDVTDNVNNSHAADMASATKKARRMSLMESIDPRSKLLMLITGLTALFATPPTGTICLFIWALLAWNATGSRRIASPVLRSVLILGVVTVATHTFWGAPPYDLELAGLHISRSGLARGILLAARLVTMAIAANALTASTSPLALAGALQWLLYPLRKLGVTPPDLPMLLAISARFLPEVQADARRLGVLRKLRQASELGTTARRKRWHTSRSLARTGRELLIPLLRLALRRASALGDTLALRGYRPGNEPQLPAFDLTGPEIIAWLVTGIFVVGAWLVSD